MSYDNILDLTENMKKFKINSGMMDEEEETKEGSKNRINT